MLLRNTATAFFVLFAILTIPLAFVYDDHVATVIGFLAMGVCLFVVLLSEESK